MTPRDRQTGTTIIGDNSLHLMHSMQPNNNGFTCFAARLAPWIALYTMTSATQDSNITH